jgi:hypothetical protein
MEERDAWTLVEGGSAATADATGKLPVPRIVRAN